MNIFLRELKAHRKSLIIWSIAMVLLIIESMGEYSAGVTSGEGSFNELVEQLPEFLQNLYGIGVFDLSKVLDFIGVFFLYISLMGSIHAVMLGNGIISKEERDKTVEFLMVKPVSRQKVITSKLLSSLAIIIIFNIVTFASIFLALVKYSGSDPFMSDFIKLMAAFFALQVLFAALGAFFAACFNRPKLSSIASTGVLMFMFILTITIDISGKLDFLSFLTFFKYFDAKDILKQGYNVAYPIISIALAAVLIYGTYYFYKKRDLRV